MTDTTSSALSLAEVARRLPRLRAGRPVAPETIYRWIVSGVRGPGGVRIKLRALRIGCRWAVIPEDLDDFFTALGDRPENADAPPPPRTPGKRERAAALAGAELEAAGY